MVRETGVSALGWGRIVFQLGRCAGRTVGRGCT
jgi:hypothetical protein